MIILNSYTRVFFITGEWKSYMPELAVPYISGCTLVIRGRFVPMRELILGEVGLPDEIHIVHGGCCDPNDYNQGMVLAKLTNMWTDGWLAENVVILSQSDQAVIDIELTLRGTVTLCAS